MKKIIDKLNNKGYLSHNEWVELIKNHNEEADQYMFKLARLACDKVYEKQIFIRGLIEYTNYCKNDCFYCGIRNSNKCAERYRLTAKQILECCKNGYSLGFRTFVLQGGEDEYFNDDKMVEIIALIKSNYPDCAITLSIGEKSKESYNKYYTAGAERYLLRHETADCEHYKRLHPKAQTLENRIGCLYELKKIGYQVGCGFMVGSPFQSIDTLAKDMEFIKKLSPQMVGIGPFIPHHDTPFKNFSTGSVTDTLFFIAAIRLMLPNALIPATTALATLDADGREKGILAGANVVMPNLSPITDRKKYMLYDDKAFSGLEAAEAIAEITKKINSIGYNVAISRGDFKYQK